MSPSSSHDGARLGRLRRRRHVVVTLLILGILVSGVGYWYVDTPKPTPTPVWSKPEPEDLGAPSGLKPIVSEGVDIREPATAQLGWQAPATLPPLPPEDVPLAQQLASLLERARAGDPVATCRLAIGASRCTAHALVSQFSSRLQRDPLAQSGEISAESRQSAAMCVGFDAASVGEVEQLLVRNQDHFNIRQKVLMALVQPDGSLLAIPRDLPRGSIGSATTQYVYSQFQADHAMPFLQEGYQQRDPLALEGMIMVHVPSDVPGFHPGIRLAMPNPKLFLGYAILMSEVYGAEALGPIVSQTVANVMQTIDPVTLRAIQEDVRREAIAWRNQPAADTEAFGSDPEQYRHPRCDR